MLIDLSGLNVCKWSNTSIRSQIVEWQVTFSRWKYTYYCIDNGFGSRTAFGHTWMSHKGRPSQETRSDDESEATTGRKELIRWCTMTAHCSTPNRLPFYLMTFCLVNISVSLLRNLPFVMFVWSTYVHWWFLALPLYFLKDFKTINIS